jgi:transposase
VLSHPKQTKAIAAARLKNDRVDAERLALLLRGDLLPRVWIPPTALREARELVRHRIQLVWLRGVIRNRLQAMLARRNRQPTSGKSWLTQRGQRELKQLPLTEAPSRIREDCAALLPTLDRQIRRLDAELVTRWGQDPRVQRLTTIPGIGPFIAIVLVLELGDIQRFASAKRVASYVGLTPRVRGSAGRVRAGHITKEGNRLLRWVLVLAATHAVRKPGPLRTWFHAVKKRRGKKVARVALARRLAEIVFHVWKHECDYFTVVRHGVVRGSARTLTWSSDRHLDWAAPFTRFAVKRN